MSLTRSGDTLHYASRRRWPGPRTAVSTMTVRVGDPVSEPSAVDRFVTARWGLHTQVRGRTRHLPNAHPRWPLHRATLVDLEENLMVAAGLPAATEPPCSVLYSPGVPVTFGAGDVLPATPGA